MDKIKIGFAPTRRSIFSAPDAVKYANLTRDRLTELGVEFVDITDINEEGLLYSDEDLPKIISKFKAKNVDGLFVPHCNFGTEYIVAKLVKELALPVLLWGPRDERPDENGIRLRDTQCGLFATGKVLRRFQVPFTYLKNCRLTDAAFEDGVNRFLAVCNTVRAFRNIRILQISTRPYDFLTCMCNEGELLETYGIELAPIPMPELTAAVKAAKTDSVKVSEVVAYITANMDVRIKPEDLETVAALKVAMRELADKYKCCAIAIQCWDYLQSELGIMPCAANSLLTDEGLPVVCETDIHGAITSILVQAAGMGLATSFFADWTVRHPDNENAELLQHCGPWPVSVANDRAIIGYPLAFEHPGAVEALARPGQITLARFDGDNGDYSLLLGNALTVDGPHTKGTYMWVEVENLDRLEEKVVCGPYIHHCTGLHGDVVPVLYEACKYINVAPDLYDPIDEKIKARIRGEALLGSGAILFKD